MNCCEGCWAPDWFGLLAQDGKLHTLLREAGFQSLMAGSRQFVCLSLISCTLDGFLPSWEHCLIACSRVPFVLSLSWFCVLTSLLKKGETFIFANFLEVFKDGVAHNLCMFFLSKIWPSWMRSEVWFPFSLPELFICARFVLAHVVFPLLQLPVQVARISSGGLGVLLDWSHQPQLRALSVQRDPSFFETSSGFIIKCLCFCTAE